jgi:SH3-like domain-containing protein
MRPLRDSPVEGAEPVAKLEPGVIGRLEKCDTSWCRISVKTHRGWIRHGEVFGVKPGERVE